MPPSHPQWSHFEDAILFELRARGYTWPDVSRVLGRGVHACRKRCFRRFGNDESVRRTWKTTEDAALFDMRAQGYSWSDISKVLKRTHRACRARYEREHKSPDSHKAMDKIFRPPILESGKEVSPEALMPAMLYATQPLDLQTLSTSSAPSMTEDDADSLVDRHLPDLSMYDHMSAYHYPAMHWSSAESSSSSTSTSFDYAGPPLDVMPWISEVEQE